MAIAQNSPTHPTTTTKRVSHYMQEIGLLYLETTKKLLMGGLENAAATPLMDPTQPSEVNSYGDVLREMEDHIQVNIASATDKQYFRLLQRTKAAADLAVFGDKSGLYTDCVSLAHLTALQGSMSSGNCTERRYEETLRLVNEALLKAASSDLERAEQHLAETLKGGSDLTPSQRELCAQDATFDFCVGTPERKAYDEKRSKAVKESDDQQRRELCAKGVFDKDYCAKLNAPQTSVPDK